MYKYACVFISPQQGLNSSPAPRRGKNEASVASRSSSEERKNIPKWRGRFVCIFSYGAASDWLVRDFPDGIRIVSDSGDIWSKLIGISYRGAGGALQVVTQQGLIQLNL